MKYCHPDDYKYLAELEDKKSLKPYLYVLPLMRELAIRAQSFDVSGLTETDIHSTFDNLDEADIDVLAWARNYVDRSMEVGEVGAKEDENEVANSRRS
jgi:hypothetical protein